MKINFQRLCRFLVPLVLVTCLVITLAVPTFAAEIYNYTNYVSKIEPDSSNSDNVLVYVDLPTNPEICIIDHTAQVRYYSSDSYLTIDMIAGHRYQVWFSSFGNIHPFNYTDTPWSGDLLNVSSIPAGSRLVQGVHVSYNGNTTIDGFSGRIYMGNSTTSLSSTEYAYESKTDGMLGWVYTLVGGYKYMATQQYSNEFVADVTDKFTFEIVTSQIVMSLNQIVYENAQSGANKELLQQIENKLDENGQKLDDIMNNTPVPKRPNGTDRFQVLEEIEGTLRENSFNALDAFLEMSNSTSEGLLPYFTSMLAVTALIEMFADLPFFQVLLGVSFCLGLTGTILGIYNGVHSRSDNGPSSEQLKEARKFILENHHKGDK